MRAWMVLMSAVVVLPAAAAEPKQALTPKTLQEALAAKPAPAEANQLAERIRGYFGKEALRKGPAPKIDELTVAWAIEVPGALAPPRVVSASPDRKLTIPLARIGTSDIYAAAVALPSGTGMRWHYQV